jgi:hypothetical protein
VPLLVSLLGCANGSIAMLLNNLPGNICQTRSMIQLRISTH